MNPICVIGQAREPIPINRRRSFRRHIRCGFACWCGEDPGVTNVVTLDDLTPDNHATSACRGFRKRWANKKSEGSEKSDPMAGASFVDLEQLGLGRSTPSLIAPESDLDSSPQFDDGVIGSASASQSWQIILSCQTPSGLISNSPENKVAQPIFDADPLPKVDLRHDVSWKTALESPMEASEQKTDQVSGPSGSLQPVFVRCVHSIREQTFIEVRERDMQAAIGKWQLVVRRNSSASDVGIQIERDPTHSFEILRASMGVKSPNTVLSRANAMLAYIRWHCLEFTSELLLPLQEEHAWRYVSHLNSIHAPPSRATSFVQACRFAHHILGFRGAVEVVNSRRITGLSEIRLAVFISQPAKQARALTVYDLQQLRRIASESQ